MLVKNLKIKISIIFFVLFVFSFASPKSLFLVYAQTKNDLNSFFINNLRDMAKVGSNKNLEILVQWEQPNKNGIWRYKVVQGRADLINHIASPAKRDVVSDLVEFVRWGVNFCPADNSLCDSVQKEG